MKEIKALDNLARTIRPISEMVNYKASEWHNFLIFIFPVVMKEVLRPIFYDHFFLLCFCVVKLTAKSITDADLILCDKLLKTFIFNLSILYSEKENTHNSHLLFHLKNVIQHIGTLSDVNGYIFENYNGHSRSMISLVNNPAKQIGRRDELFFSTNIELLKLKNTQSSVLRIKKPLDDNFRSTLNSVLNVLWEISTLTSSPSGRKQSFLFKHRIQRTDGSFTSFELPHINQIKISSKLDIVNVKDFWKKCLYIEQNQ